MRGDLARIAHGRPRQLGRDPLARSSAGSPTRSRRSRRSRPDVVAGLRRATDAAYEAVLRPVEGTILTVVRMAAESVEQALAERRDHPRATCSNGRRPRRAPPSPAHPDLLPVLRDAGVVDAGGRGFELLLDVVPERGVPNARCRRPEVVARRWRSRRTSMTATRATSPSCATRSCTSSTPTTTRSPQFKRTWGALGDSIVVVGGDGLWNCHVHTNDIGAAIEAGIDAGRPAEIRVTDLLEQVEEREEAAVGAGADRGRRRTRRARHHRGRRGRGGRRPRASCSRASVCSRSSPAVSR